MKSQSEAGLSLQHKPLYLFNESPDVANNAPNNFALFARSPQAAFKRRVPWGQGACDLDGGRRRMFSLTLRKSYF
jgi:hypothetical protein